MDVVPDRILQSQRAQCARLQGVPIMNKLFPSGGTFLSRTSSVYGFHTGLICSAVAVVLFHTCSTIFEKRGPMGV
jgi:hypothetical protein